MTEISKTREKKRQPQYSVNPTAFVVALVTAPLLITVPLIWTVIVPMALYFGFVPYLVVGTPILLWAVGRIKPAFGTYARLGFWGNVAMGVVGFLIMAPQLGHEQAMNGVFFFAGFGLIFAPLYAGAFGWLYARLNPKIRILQT